MKNQPVSLENLQKYFDELQASLLYWQLEGPGLKPVYDWDRMQIREYMRDLYRFAHECLYMRLRIDAPVHSVYQFQETCWLTRPELIKLTGDLLNLCDLSLIWSYRDTTAQEDILLRDLEQLNSQLIGAQYGQSAFEETIDVRDIRFDIE
ncbi:hypothetical protein BDD43_3558 [Mucilaginibacter gracilis]|uniref:Uncharacterized protein n=1 Tax=Mucilaginibacter gracilis TaxID=423350 RepID=A0A495J437_9SPHI|nr:hypothetical protein [Mucilaginibacter gracilis]RKR83352.1 hypothetical protein BDD43_3558 [Mucilaginibacter gracilis]